MGIEPGLHQKLADGLARLPGLARLRDAAGEAPLYLVGGAVRDILLGRSLGDIDVVVEGDAAAIAERLGPGHIAHERFGTAAIELDGLRVDIATARSETYAAPGALPDVRPATLGEDLARRDFTINAMAVALDADADLVDLFDGISDLEAGVVRVLHERSFVDDPTRALRAARYAARFGFGLDPETERLVRAADLGAVSADRVHAELRRIAAEEEPWRALQLAAGWSLIELGPGGAELVERVASLLSGEPWAEAVPRPEAILAALEGPGEGVRSLASAVPSRPSEAVALARGRSGVELALARAGGGEWLDRYLSEWRRVRLEIDGRDLLAAGVPQGPAIGRGLDAALAAKLDGEVTGRDQELAAALAAAGVET